MKKTLTACSLIVLLPACAALADDDECDAPRDQWQPREAVMQLAEKNGWTVSDFEIDDGCYEIEGRDARGWRIEVKLDPATLQMVEMEYENDDDDEGSRPANLGPVVPVAPPQNGLFENGAPPQVQVN